MNSVELDIVLLFLAVSFSAPFGSSVCFFILCVVVVAVWRRRHRCCRTANNFECITFSLWHPRDIHASWFSSCFHFHRTNHTTAILLFFCAAISRLAHKHIPHDAHAHQFTTGKCRFFCCASRCLHAELVYLQPSTECDDTHTHTHRRSRPAFSLCWNVFLSSRVRPRDDTFTSICMRACRQQYKTEVTNNTENENRFVR